MAPGTSRAARCAAGDDVSHAAGRVGDVAAVARDQVDVEVEDGLAGGFADVDADVEAVGGVDEMPIRTF
jgi:hypothetical protein